VPSPQIKSVLSPSTGEIVNVLPHLTNFPFLIASKIPQNQTQFDTLQLSSFLLTSAKMPVSVPIKLDTEAMTALNVEDVRVFVRIQPNHLPSFNPLMDPILDGELHPGSGRHVAHAVMRASEELSLALFGPDAQPTCEHNVQPIVSWEHPEKKWLEFYFYLHKENLGENGTEKAPVLHLTSDEVVGGVVEFKARWLGRRGRAGTNKMFKDLYNFYKE